MSGRSHVWTTCHVAITLTRLSRVPFVLWGWQHWQPLCLFWSKRHCDRYQLLLVNGKQSQIFKQSGTNITQKSTNFFFLRAFWYVTNTNWLVSPGLITIFFIVLVFGYLIDLKSKNGESVSGAHGRQPPVFVRPMRHQLNESFGTDQYSIHGCDGSGFSFQQGC